MAQRSTRSCPARAFPKTLVILATLATLSGCDRAPTPAPSKPAPAAKPTAPPGWTCGTKTTCGQMSRCDEAKFYLTQCGVKNLDRDGDGVPCASLCR